MWSAPLNSCKCCARSVAGADNSTGGTDGNGGQHENWWCASAFCWGKASEPSKIQWTWTWSNLDHQAPVKTKILVSVEICWSREAGSSDVGNAGKDKFL